MPDTRIQYIKPCDPHFVEFIEQVRAKLPLFRCGRPDCKVCTSDDVRSFEFAHYSRDGINEWKFGHDGNQFCWSQYYSDSAKELRDTTQQPSGGYRQLCLVKIADCMNLRYQNEEGGDFEQFRLDFSIPAASIVRIELETSREEREVKYICKQIL